MKAGGRKTRTGLSVAAGGLKPLYIYMNSFGPNIAKSIKSGNHKFKKFTICVAELRFGDRFN